MDAKWNVGIFYLIGFVGMLIFTKGFFPSKNISGNHATSMDIPPTPISKAILSRLLDDDMTTKPGSVNGSVPSGPHLIRKLILVIIDAMRLDFITSNVYKQHMPFLHGKLHTHGRLLLSKAREPTVTMPRIKAITTGSIPGYVDVLLNMDSAELRIDNIISSSQRHGKRLVFYGDNTWLKLFPSAFIRHDGTTSFFVTDYTEVDRNVTQHLHRELHLKTDWDVMVLHYLGLDHIGHLAGPTSSLVLPKLREMDDVISTVYSSVQSQTDALVVITSDHGMSGIGSHGGTTEAETDTPLVLLSSAFEPTLNLARPETVQQIDMAPSLALGLGIPIPLHSMGKTIDALTDLMDGRSQLSALQYNCHHLLRRLSVAGSLQREVTSFDDSSLNQEIASTKKSSNPLSAYRNGLQFHANYLEHGKSNDLAAAKVNYARCQHIASDRLTATLASYNYKFMALGMLTIYLSVCGVAFCWLRYMLRCRHAETSAAASTWSKTFVRFALALCGGCLLQVAMLAGSSFVEEEHQIWHFLTISLSIALLIGFLRVAGTATNSVTGSDIRTSRNCLYDAQLDVMRPRSYETRSVAAERDSPADGKVVGWMVVAAALGVLVCHRLLKSWNQTGVKFVDQPDIGDWLTAPDNKLALSVSSVVGLTLTLTISRGELRTTQDRVRSILASCGFLLVYLYRCQTGALSSPFAFASASSADPNMGLTEARSVYAIVALLFAKSIFHLVTERYAAHHRPTTVPTLLCCLPSTDRHRGLDSFQSGLLVLSALVLRPHNHLPLAMHLFLFAITYKRLWPVLVEGKVDEVFKSASKPPTGVSTVSSYHAVARIVVAYWFGQHAYFTLGNSNSLATVDLSSAYIGLSTSEGWFNMLVSFALCSFTTYLGPILWITLCLVDLIKQTDGDLPTSKRASPSSGEGGEWSLCTWALLRMTTMACYTSIATGHRYHLFVWSVFSPKLLYEFVATAVHGALFACAIAVWR